MRSWFNSVQSDKSARDNRDFEDGSKSDLSAPSGGYFGLDPNAITGSLFGDLELKASDNALPILTDTEVVKENSALSSFDFMAARKPEIMEVTTSGFNFMSIAPETLPDSSAAPTNILSISEPSFRSFQVPIEEENGLEENRDESKVENEFLANAQSNLPYSNTDILSLAGVEIFTASSAESAVAIELKLGSVSRPIASTRRKKPAVRVGYARDTVTVGITNSITDSSHSTTVFNPQDIVQGESYMATLADPMDELEKVSESYDAPVIEGINYAYSSSEKSASNSYDLTAANEKAYASEKYASSPAQSSRNSENPTPEIPPAKNSYEDTMSQYRNIDSAPEAFSNLRIKTEISSCSSQIPTLSSSAAIKSRGESGSTVSRRPSSFSIFDKMKGLLSSSTPLPPPRVRRGSSESTSTEASGQANAQWKQSISANHKNVEEFQDKTSLSFTDVDESQKETSVPPRSPLLSSPPAMSTGKLSVLVSEDLVSEPVIGSDVDDHEDFDIPVATSRLQSQVILIGEMIAESVKQQNLLRVESSAIEKKISLLHKRVEQDEEKQAKLAEAEEFEEADAMNASILSARSSLLSAHEQFNQFQATSELLNKQLMDQRTELLKKLGSIRTDLCDGLDNTVLSMKMEVNARLKAVAERLHEEKERVAQAQRNVERDKMNLQEERAQLERSFTAASKAEEARRGNINARKRGVEHEIAELQKALRAKRADLAEIMNELSEVDDVAEKSQLKYDRLFARIQEREKILAAAVKDCEMESEALQKSQEKHAESVIRARTDIRKQRHATRSQRHQVSMARLLHKVLSRHWETQESLLSSCPEENDNIQKCRNELLSAEAEEAALLARIAEFRAEQRELSREAHLLGASVTPIEEAKKAAVIARNYKEAGTLSAQLKQISARTLEITDRLQVLDTSCLEDQIVELRSKVEKKRDALSASLQMTEKKRFRELRSRALKLKKCNEIFQARSNSDWAVQLISAETLILESRMRMITDNFGFSVNASDTDSDSESTPEQFSPVSGSSYSSDEDDDDDDDSDQDAAQLSCIIQNGLAHNGLDTHEIPQSSNSLREMLADLENQISKAVINEDYELAADLDIQLQATREMLESENEITLQYPKSQSSQNRTESEAQIDPPANQPVPGILRASSIPEQNLPSLGQSRGSLDLPELPQRLALESEPEATRDGIDPEAAIQENQAEGFRDTHSNEGDSTDNEFSPETAAWLGQHPEGERASVEDYLQLDEVEIEVDTGISDSARSPEDAPKSLFSFMSVENARSQSHSPIDLHPEGLNCYERENSNLSEETHNESQPEPRIILNLNFGHETVPPETTENPHELREDPEHESNIINFDASNNFNLSTVAADEDDGFEESKLNNSEQVSVNSDSSQHVQHQNSDELTTQDDGPDLSANEMAALIIEDFGPRPPSSDIPNSET